MRCRVICGKPHISIYQHMSGKHDDPSTIAPPISAATKQTPWLSPVSEETDAYDICALCVAATRWCASCATGSATPTTAAVSQPGDPTIIVVTVNDFTDRRYDVVGDISVLGLEEK
jgi:hypothetical protein